MTADPAGPAGPFAAGTAPPFRWTAEHDEFRGATMEVTEASGRWQPEDVATEVADPGTGLPRDRDPYADRPFEERPHG